MLFQIIATHNPQDFFEGKEPEDLCQYCTTEEKDLSRIVKGCLQGGYVVIVYNQEV